MNLDDYRKEIDIIDKKMKDLFIKRMNLVNKVVEYKIENNLPVLDSNREKEMFSNIDINDDYRKFYIDFLTQVIRISKEYQEEQK